MEDCTKWSVRDCTRVPLNKTTQLKHRNINEDYESAISDKEAHPDTEECLETEIVTEYDNSITLDDIL